jgi:hypothetical protein
MTDQATFKESSRRRPWYKRLTPVAWALIAVLALSCVGCGIVGGNWALPQLFTRDEWATATPVPTEPTQPTAEPTEGPTPTPTEWWEGDVTATPTLTEVVEPFPAWWSDEMTQDADGQWWPPDEVIEDVKENWYRDLEGYELYLVNTKPPDYDAYEEHLYVWYMGEELEGALNGLEAMRSGKEPISFADWETCLLSAQDFSADGLECTMSVSCQDGVISDYDPETGALLSQEEQDYLGLFLFRMRYDPSDGHWKRFKFLEFVPPD